MLGTLKVSRGGDYPKERNEQCQGLTCVKRANRRSESTKTGKNFKNQDSGGKGTEEDVS